MNPKTWSEFLESCVSDLMIAPPIGDNFLTAVKHSVKQRETLWSNVRPCETMWRKNVKAFWDLELEDVLELSLASAVHRAWHQKVQQFTTQPWSKRISCGVVDEGSTLQQLVELLIIQFVDMAQRSEWYEMGKEWKNHRHNVANDTSKGCLYH